jgi:HEPN domain-containing protein
MPAAQPIGWFLFADSYLACADTLRRNPPARLRFDAPVRYLLFHAMELYLKAFLRLKGVGEAELRSRALGHDLVALANRAEDLGLSLGEAVKEVVADAHLSDEPIEARYLDTGVNLRRLNVDSIYANCDSLRDSVRADFGVEDIPTPSRP